MHRQIADMIPLFFFFVFFSSLTTGFGVEPHVAAGQDSKPYTPKAYLIRYWNTHIQNNLPLPNFLLSKASPLSAVQSATFAKLAADHAISTHLPQFCSSARLLCFTVGHNDSFTNYASDGNKNYASDGNKNYGNKFKNYRDQANVKRGVEAGKFFRESMLKEGTVMPMPDIRDRMPKRSFLPRSILSKLPFSTSKVSELKQIFKIQDHSTMDKLVSDSLHECERAPSPGETKRCVGSIEDMIDFATSVLDRNIAVLTTQNVNGSKKDVMVGQVRGIHGGRVTKSVSCHQSLFPYLLYYCHSVPKVRVYEADLLDPFTKSKINHGVAICHIDTSSWSAGHEAFLSLGSGPGRIEVCHWIFKKDMIWTIAD